MLKIRRRVPKGTSAGGQFAPQHVGPQTGIGKRDRFSDPFSEPQRIYEAKPLAAAGYQPNPYKFGPGNEKHAEIADTLSAAHSAIEKSGFTSTSSSGTKTTYNFNPLFSVHPHVKRLASQVLESSPRHSKGGNASALPYPRHSDVYSSDTVAFARRIDGNLSTTVFMEPAYPGEATTLYPSVTRRDGQGNEQVDYHLHPAISGLLQCVARDQAEHAGLQADARKADPGRSTSRKWL